MSNLFDVRLSEEQRLELNKNMLRFVYHKNLLFETYFMSIWIDFKRLHTTVELTAMQLKLEFHCHIIKDLNKYHLDYYEKAYFSSLKYYPGKEVDLLHNDVLEGVHFNYPNEINYIGPEKVISIQNDIEIENPAEFRINVIHLSSEDDEFFPVPRSTSLPICLSSTFNSNTSTSDSVDSFKPITPSLGTNKKSLIGRKFQEIKRKKFEKFKEQRKQKRQREKTRKKM